MRSTEYTRQPAILVTRDDVVRLNGSEWRVSGTSIFTEHKALLMLWSVAGDTAHLVEMGALDMIDIR